MGLIDVSCRPSADAWDCLVIVRDGGETQHRVRVSRSDLERLAPGTASPDELVRASFEFLLEREPAESILRAFDLPVIGRYFPEYERDIRRRFGPDGDGRTARPK